LFLLARVDRVSANVVKKQRHFGAVLHRRNKQVGELKSVASFVLVAPLNTDNQFDIATRATWIMRAIR